jgi:SpoVK/Ycf46/Vps4 family AAA+-type ATPase
MTSAHLLKDLFRNYKRRDEDGFYAIAMQIIAEEKRRNHNVLAKELQSIIDNGIGRSVDSPRVFGPGFDRLPKDKERGTTLLEILSSDKNLSDIILDDTARNQVDIVLEEFRSGALLQTYGLRPRRRLLCVGPPGCGKTLCAEVIAGELGLPLLYTRFDAVISSYLGETAANLRKVFDFAAGATWVVFFDEFDAIGKSRDDLEEHGELKRVVNTFLQLLDNFRSDSLVIAATNHDFLLDKALWRRFDDIIYFGLPSASQIHALMHIKLRGFRHQRVNLEHFIPDMTEWSHSDVERVCMEAVKIAVIAGKDELDDVIFNEAMHRQAHRSQLIRAAHRKEGIGDARRR